MSVVCNAISHEANASNLLGVVSNDVESVWIEWWMIDNDVLLASNEFTKRNSSILLNLLMGGVSPNRFLSDPDPYRSSGHIDTTKQHENSRRIQWDQSRGLNPRFSEQKNCTFELVSEFSQAFASPSGQTHCREAHPKSTIFSKGSTGLRLPGRFS